MIIILSSFHESEFLGVSEENQFRKQDSKKVEFEDIQPLENQFKYFLESREGRTC